MTDSIQPIIDFCERYKGVPINEWLRLPGFDIDIYVRRTRRVIDGDIADTIDLASFEIVERSRGQGRFTRLIEQVEEYAWSKGLVVYVECVHNERLRGFLERRGYNLNSAEDRCYAKAGP